MVAPGGGAGNTAAAFAQVKAVMDPLHKALAAFPVGSKEYKAVLAMLNAGSKVFGEAQEGNLVPAAVAQMAKAAQAGNSPLASVAPGMAAQPAPPPGGGAAPAAPPAMAA